MLPTDYEERVYAGVLGKVIAVYLGRPFEGWTYERISRELGEITGYVNDRTDLALKNHLLVVTDDDISGTFVFPRALRDHGPEPTSAQVGDTWLNEILEGTSVLWWGGVGNSTEHTAYLHLKDGVRAPESGTIARNGVVVAEQVGAQIFVEGFAMTRPGDPEAAADLVERAARVSHDGESVHAARVVAALVAGAFTETDMDKLLDIAVGLIPADSARGPPPTRSGRPPGPGSTSATATTATAATATWCPTMRPSSTRWPAAGARSCPR
jgi:ADP-ribosylglycohydrolase